MIYQNLNLEPDGRIDGRPGVIGEQGVRQRTGDREWDAWKWRQDGKHGQDVRGERRRTGSRSVRNSDSSSVGSGFDSLVALRSSSMSSPAFLDLAPFLEDRGAPRSIHSRWGAVACSRFVPGGAPIGISRLTRSARRVTLSWDALLPVHPLDNFSASSGC